MPKLADCLRVRLDQQTQAKRLQAYEDAAYAGLAATCSAEPFDLAALTKIQDMIYGRQGTEEKAHPPI